MVNRFLDMALFYDAGKVAPRPIGSRPSDMKSDYGIGFRFHGAVSTPLRIELAKGNEGMVLIFCGVTGRSEMAISAIARHRP